MAEIRSHIVYKSGVHILYAICARLCHAGPGSRCRRRARRRRGAPPPPADFLQIQAHSLETTTIIICIHTITDQRSPIIVFACQKYSSVLVYSLLCTVQYQCRRTDRTRGLRAERETDSRRSHRDTAPYLCSL